MSPRLLWPWPDRVMGWMCAPKRPARAPLPAPRDLPAYAWLASAWAPRLGRDALAPAP